MYAIILAAGRGMRLYGGDRASTPKCMENINGISIIHYQIRNCLSCGINRFIIVVGYKKDILESHILEVLKQEQVIFIENERFAETNTLYSLWLTHDHMKESFIYFNADVLFHPELLKKLYERRFQNVSTLLIEKKAVGEEEVKVICQNRSGDFQSPCRGVARNELHPIRSGDFQSPPYSKITRINKQIDPSVAEGEFIGIGMFVHTDSDIFIESLKQGIDEGQHNNYFEWAVDLMCSQTELRAIYTDGLPCIEIDFPEDLVRAKEMFK